MHTKLLVRLFAIMLMLGLFGGTQAMRAQEEGGDAGDELGVGLYLGNCESLVEGAALFDLGDVELETEEFGTGDENAEEGGDENAEEGAEDEGESLEDELSQESGQDETDVEGAIGGDEGDEGEGGEASDREVVVQEDSPPVYVSTGSTFEASLADLVEEPIAVAVRLDATDEAATEGSTEAAGGAEGEFVACGTFGGAVAGNQIIIPLVGIENDDFSGIAILEQTGDNESTASIYLFGGEDDGGEEEDEEATPAS